MELATDTKAFSAYSPTSTPILDNLRAMPHHGRGKLSAGEYFFLSSLIILTLIGLPALREAFHAVSANALGPWIVLMGIPAAALGLASLIHELGHLLAGKLAGFRLARINLGRSRPDRCAADQKLHACEILPAGVWVFGPGKIDHLRRRLFLLFAGGPLAGILFAVLLEISPYWTSASGQVQFGVHVLAAFCLLLGIAALLPDTSRRGHFSDGARLLMLWKNDVRAGRWMANLHLQLALGNGIHPRDWEQTMVVRATLINDDSRDAVTAHWLAYLWAAERQDITSATKYLEDALAAPAASSAWLRDRLFLEAAVFQAWFRDNPAKARSWAGLIRDGKLTRLQQQRLTIVLLWAEGQLFEAWERMGDYLRLLQQLPDSPARVLAEKSALEWKHQMESRMLTRAWRTMYTMLQQVEMSLPAAVS